MKNKKALIIFSLIFVMVLFVPVNIYALDTSSFSLVAAGCGVLGNPQNPESTAWLLQELFSIVKYLGPFLLLVLSSIDFIKAIILSDDETMKKAQKRLLIRAVLVVVLFLVPDSIFVILQIFDIVGNPNSPTCGIE